MIEQLAQFGDLGISGIILIILYNLKIDYIQVKSDVKHIKENMRHDRRRKPRRDNRN